MAIRILTGHATENRCLRPRIKSSSRKSGWRQFLLASPGSGHWHLPSENIAPDKQFSIEERNSWVNGQRRLWCHPETNHSTQPTSQFHHWVGPSNNWQHDVHHATSKIYLDMDDPWTGVLSVVAFTVHATCCTTQPCKQPRPNWSLAVVRSQMRNTKPNDNALKRESKPSSTRTVPSFISVFVLAKSAFCL